MECIIICILSTLELLAMIRYIVKKELQLKEFEDKFKMLLKENIDIKSRLTKIEKNIEKPLVLTNEQFKEYQKIHNKF